MANRRPPKREGRPRAWLRPPSPRPARVDADQPQPGAAVRSSRPSPPSHPTPHNEPHGPERLQKILAHAGVGSRRACED